MIDIHSHILPAVDDGAKDMAESLELLRLVVADGVTDQVLTPHLSEGHYEESVNGAKTAFSLLQGAVDDAGINIRLHLSAEVMISHAILKFVEYDDMPWIGSWEGRKAFLMDLPQFNLPFGGDQLVSRLVSKNIQPILAHPERNYEIQNDISKIKPYIASGCLLQINCGSLLGDFGATVFKAACDLLKMNHVTFLASDCHNLTERYPNLKSGMEVASDIVGKTAAYEMVTKAPGNLIHGVARS
ncbi:hypothetical protein MNBD_NITROSPINAE01-1933 [hydrothermal vent metagenome]|uniref:Protein-tyrosine-phosphatase n=1 Tax=hydrothermal vent metagenome TaxID=652676 RepID=A0A3B1C8Y5_9ZZZZ